MRKEVRVSQPGVPTCPIRSRVVTIFRCRDCLTEDDHGKWGRECRFRCSLLFVSELYSWVHADSRRILDWILKSETRILKPVVEFFGIDNFCLGCKILEKFSNFPFSPVHIICLNWHVSQLFPTALYYPILRFKMFFINSNMKLSSTWRDKQILKNFRWRHVPIYHPENSTCFFPGKSFVKLYRLLWLCETSSATPRASQYWSYPIINFTPLAISTSTFIL